MSVFSLVVLCLVVVCTVALKSFRGIELLGRFSLRDDEYSANWPASGIRFAVLPQANNDQITVNMTYKNCVNNCKYYIGVFVDKEEISKTEINSSNDLVTATFPSKASSDGTTRPRVVELRKITEVSSGDAEGTMVLGDLQLSGGTLMGSTASSAQRRILVVGDSITCGYGVDQNDPCAFQASTEDVTHAYAYVLSRAVEADIDVVAWSGKGVVRNYGDANKLSDLPMPGYYNRTLATEAATSVENNYWMPHRYSPNLVMISLGTNDYSTQPQPSDDQFISGYVNFIHQIQKDHPTAKILTICQPLNNGNQCKNTEAAAKQAVVDYVAVPYSTMDGGWGCSGHPNYASQQNIAQYITPVVQKMMQW